MNSFENFAPLPSNSDAVDAALKFSAGMIPFVAIVGPSGWGKSHLLDAISERYNREGEGCSTRIDCQRLLANPRPETHRVLVVDDVQEVFGKSKIRQQMRMLLERRAKAARPTVLAFTAPKPNRQIRLLLPNAREWVVAGIAEPATEERVLLLGHLSKIENLLLSDELTQILARHMHVNGRTLSGALKRLKLSGENWNDSKSALRACGLLNPFFSDNPDWDLQHKIIRFAAAEGSCTESSRDLALYSMMCVAGLPETDVARWAGVEPSEAYARTRQFRKHLSASPEKATCLKRLIEALIHSLAVD